MKKKTLLRLIEQQVRRIEELEHRVYDLEQRPVISIEPIEPARPGAAGRLEDCEPWTPWPDSTAAPSQPESTKVWCGKGTTAVTVTNVRPGEWTVHYLPTSDPDTIQVGAHAS